MAEEGDNLTAIKEAGEWTSGAHERYCDTEHVDRKRALWAALEASDREDE